MSILIKKACVSNLKEVHHVMDTCTQWLVLQNLKHWVNAYPLETLKGKIAKNIVYLIQENQKVIGTISLSKKRTLYYTDADDQYWQEPKAEAIYMSGLAVLPKQMGKGYATKLIEYAEEKNRQKGIKFLRFDAVAHYKSLIQFYQKKGFEIVRKRKAYEYEHYFFEKCL